MMRKIPSTILGYVLLAGPAILWIWPSMHFFHPYIYEIFTNAGLISQLTCSVMLIPAFVTLAVAAVVPMLCGGSLAFRLAVSALAVAPCLPPAISFFMWGQERKLIPVIWATFLPTSLTYVLTAAIVAGLFQVVAGWSFGESGERRFSIWSIMRLAFVAAVAFAFAKTMDYTPGQLPGLFLGAVAGAVTSIAIAGFLSEQTKWRWTALAFVISTLGHTVWAYYFIHESTTSKLPKHPLIFVACGVFSSLLYFGYLSLFLLWLRRCNWRLRTRPAAKTRR